MKPALFVLLTSMLFASVLAGCVDSGDEGGGTGPDVDAGEDTDPDQETGKDLWLEDLQECRGNYPPEREEPVRCEHDLDTFDPLDGPPEGDWECVEEASAEHSPNTWARLYRDTTQGGYAIHYNTTSQIPVSGILATGTNESSQYRNWNHGHGNATLHLGTMEPGTNLTLHAFVTHYTSEHEDLQNGTFHVIWSRHDDAPYPVRVLETEETTYYFQHALHRPGETFPYLWGVSMNLEGDDFAIEIYYFDLIRVGLHIPDDPDAGPGC